MAARASSTALSRHGCGCIRPSIAPRILKGPRQAGIASRRSRGRGPPPPRRGGAHGDWRHAQPTGSAAGRAGSVHRHADPAGFREETTLLCGVDLDRQPCRDHGGDIVLKLEHVAEDSAVAVGPDDPPRFRPRQARPEAVAWLPLRCRPPVQQVPNAQLAPIWSAGKLWPLNRKTEWRAMTNRSRNRLRLVMMSPVIPSQRCWSRGSPDRLSKGNTATEAWSSRADRQALAHVLGPTGERSRRGASAARSSRSRRSRSVRRCS